MIRSGFRTPSHEATRGSLLTLVHRVHGERMSQFTRGCGCCDQKDSNHTRTKASITRRESRRGNGLVGTTEIHKRGYEVGQRREIVAREQESEAMCKQNAMRTRDKQSATREMAANRSEARHCSCRPDAKRIRKWGCQLVTGPNGNHNLIVVST